MEADWEFEIGGESPVIEALWPGFVDLRTTPERVNEIAEAHAQPGLAEALVRLNAGNSPVWTCKCDVFAPDRIDGDELEAHGEDTEHAVVSYIDLLMRSEQAWDSPEKSERDCRNICERIRAVPLRCCRMDLVIRRAFVGDRCGLGATVYLTACGRSKQEARARLAECMALFVDTVVPLPDGHCAYPAGPRK